MEKEEHKITVYATSVDNVISMLNAKNIKLLFDEELLYKYISNGEKLIDYLIKNGYFDEVLLNVNTDLRIMEYCVKYNCFSFVSDEILDILFEENNGCFLAEDYLDNTEFIDRLTCYDLDDKIIIKLYKKGYKKIAINANESVLLTTLENDVTILEDMLKSGMLPTFFEYEFNKEETFEILMKYKKYELLYKASMELLMNHPSEDNNYLDVLIHLHYNGFNVFFERKNYVSDDKELLARCYIQMIDNRLIKYMNELTEDDLVSCGEGGKSLLYYLVKSGKSNILDSILTIRLRKSKKVFAELEMLGVNEGLLDISYDQFNVADKYRESYNYMYDQGCESPVEDLLFKLRHLFLKDKHSDISLVDALIKSYRYLTSINPLFIEELKILIGVKEQHPDFYYIMRPNVGVFVEERNAIEVEDTTIETLIHETAHALHWYLTSYEVPNEFADFLKRITSDESFLDRISDFDKRCFDICNLIDKKAKNIVFNQVTDNDEDFKNLRPLLEKEKNDLISYYHKIGYSEEDLKIIFASLGDVFDSDSFIIHKRQIETSEVSEVISRYEYDCYSSICDILDAISNGRLASGLVYNRNGSLVSSIVGHGVRYYSFKSEEKNIEYRFSEIFANYISIIKSKNSKEMIELLRGIVGDELVDMLDDFYKTRILQLPDTRKRVVR